MQLQPGFVEATKENFERILREEGVTDQAYIDYSWSAAPWQDRQDNPAGILEEALRRAVRGHLQDEREKHIFVDLSTQAGILRFREIMIEEHYEPDWIENLLEKRPTNESPVLSESRIRKAAKDLLLLHCLLAHKEE